MTYALACVQDLKKLLSTCNTSRLTMARVVTTGRRATRQCTESASLTAGCSDVVLSLDSQKKLFLLCVKPLCEKNKHSKIASFQSLCHGIINGSEAFYERNFNDVLPNVNFVST